jgi:hypothetical protein
MNKEIMRVAGFSKQVENVEKGLCPICNSEINLEDFKDELSLKEYRISGLCQKCMDEIFGK